MLTALLTLTAGIAQAAPCDPQVAKISSLSPESVAAGFTLLAACDRKVAELNYNRFLEKATDSDALVALTLAAVDVDVWLPAWQSIGKIASYEAQDAVVLEIGAACGQNARVSAFLQKAYTELKPVDYARWDDAIKTCDDPALWSSLEAAVQSPPSASFDEKYDTVLSIYVKKKKADALPALQAAAIKAASGGPFDALVTKMGEAAAGELGGSMSADSQARFEAAMLAVAQSVPADKARIIADQLANAGSNASAATLLPKIYGDRKQKDGTWLYGVAAVELGECGGQKTAVIHYTTATEPGKRWTIIGDAEPLLRAFKPKLKDCTSDAAWVVAQSPEPVASSSDAASWAESFIGKYTKDYPAVKVSSQKEKAITLP